MKRMGFTFCIILGLHIVTSAQNDDNFPDISGNFTDYATIVAVNDVHPPMDTRPTFDDSLREIRVYDDTSESWFTYPYPDEVETVRKIDWHDEDSIVLHTIINYDFFLVDPTGDWILNLETGEYSRPELMCGVWRADAGEGRWIAYSTVDESVLCHTETGEQISLGFSYIGGIFPSPNPDLVALFADNRLYNGIYSYTFSTEELLQVGETAHYDYESIYWLGDEWFMVRQTQMPDMSFPWIYYSLANAHEADSLQYVTMAYKPGDLTLLDNPRRYEWVDFDGENCILVQIRVSDGHRDEYDIGDICSRGTLIPGSDERLTDTLITAESKWGGSQIVGRQLVRFNPYTGEQHLLLEGEIESLDEITFDGHYAVLVMDDSGQVDMLTEGQLQNYDYDRELGIVNVNFRYVVFDLFQARIVYETPTASYIGSGIPFDYFNEESGSFSLGGGIRGNFYTLEPTYSMMYLGEDRFVIGRFDEAKLQTNYSLVQIDSETSEVAIGTPILLIGDGQFLITQHVNDEEYTLVAYDIVSGEENVFFNIEGHYRQFEGFYIGQESRHRLTWKRGDSENTIIALIWDMEAQVGREYHINLSLTN